MEWLVGDDEIESVELTSKRELDAFITVTDADSLTDELSGVLADLLIAGLDAVKVTEEVGGD
jgi:hypothetical protein